MIVSDQPVLHLQLGAGLLQPEMIPERLDVPECLGMHLVDGDVHVPVVGVLVHRRDALVLREAERRAEPVLDVRELLARRPLALGEADDEVIALVGLAAGVAGLGGQDLFHRPAGIVGLAVADPCPGDLLALMGLVQYVGAEPGPARRIDAPSGVEDVGSQALEIRGSPSRGRCAWRSYSPGDLGQSPLQLGDALEQQANLDLRRPDAGPVRQPQFQQAAEPALIAVDLRQLHHRRVVEARANRVA